MFGRGTDALLEALPQIHGLDDSVIRRLLSSAWLEVAEQRDLGAPRGGHRARTDALRRLALALQVHAVIVPDLHPTTVRSCAFVAAEALDVARELDALAEDAPQPSVERILVGLLYLIGGFDANAAVSVRGVTLEPDVPAEKAYALGAALALLAGRPSPMRPAATAGDATLLHERVRAALWRTVGEALVGFNAWLRDPEREDHNYAGELRDVADDLRLSDEDIPVAVHPDIQHFARVASTALREATRRALRSVVPPEEGRGAETFRAFLAARCVEQPLLWPAAAEYATAALPGPSVSAVVAVPTGAGKSGVADLAIQHAISRGWVLYLAPTNALVGQIRRQLRRDHPHVTVREFLGGAEYTALSGEALDDITVGQVLVMTPEKCSLALRQTPEAFETLSLLVFDEAHLLGDRRGRGALSELVLAEVLTRAADARVLLMSALVANPEALADWFNAISAPAVAVIREPWRPTRTLRAVVGIDKPTAVEAAQDPATTLAGLPIRRRNVSFEAPLAVLAGLRGPWATNERNDYALVRVGATTPVNVTRPRGGGNVTIDSGSAGVRPTVEALAQLLGDQGQKVMAFLPRSKHDSFLAALALPGFGHVDLSTEVDAFIGLAEAELGVESMLGQVLRKGVGVHTSALLPEERRASEIAFDEGHVAVLFATGTLAQGLNLPATTVIIGGTDIGYDAEQTPAERQRQQRSQLLNAIGRAGRARVAARSLALVVPNTLPWLDSDTLVQTVLPQAAFLAEEDASTQLSSVLRPLLGRLQTQVVDLDELYVADHLALAYLAQDGVDQDEDEASTEGILRRTWAVHQLELRDQIQALAGTIHSLGRRALEESGGPPWAAEAARRAGVPLPIAARFATVVLRAEADEDWPESVAGWLSLMMDAVADVPRGNLGLLLQRNAFRSTALQGLWSADPGERATALDVTRRTLEAWLAGDSLAVVGGVAHGTAPIDRPGRGQQDPIPRTIRLVDNGVGFGFTRAAGLLAASFDVAVEQAAIQPLTDVQHAALERLPVALRFGAADEKALALLRAGARPRAVAHVLARRLSPPTDGANDEALGVWARTQLSRFVETFDAMAFNDAEQQLLARYLLTRGAR